MAAYEAAKKVVWLKKFIMDLQVIPNVEHPNIFYCDNSGAATQSKKPKHYKRQKKYSIEVPLNL